MQHRNLGDKPLSSLRALFFLLVLLLQHTVFANSDAETKNAYGAQGIYFCSRDLNNLSSKDKRERAEQLKMSRRECKAIDQAYEEMANSDSVFISYEDAGECHSLLRHCFLLHAVLKDSKIVEGQKLLILHPLASMGFGGASVEVDGKISKRFKNVFADGPAVVYPEIDLRSDEHKNSIISCELVLDESGLTLEDLEGYRTRSHAITHKWADVINVMLEEVKAGYAAESHNCCTVAFKALKVIKSTIEEVVDPWKINFGIGVKILSPDKKGHQSKHDEL